MQEDPPLELLGLLDELANAAVVVLLADLTAGDALDELLPATAVKFEALRVG